MASGSTFERFRGAFVVEIIRVPGTFTTFILISLDLSGLGTLIGNMRREGWNYQTNNLIF
jgi:hypothetical protein